MAKKFGEFYTPQELVDFVINLLPKNHTSTPSISILEPSGGDGRFVSSILNKWNEISISSTIVEIKEDACNTSRKALAGKNVRVFNKDFLFYNVKPDAYDLVVGNPPYISKKHLTKVQLIQLRGILSDRGISSISDKNIWPAFILKGEEALNENGVMAFVLPFELLQVKFSVALQQFLMEKFEKVEIYTFQNLVFDSAGQDTVILIAHKKNINKGLFVYDIAKNEIENNKPYLPPQELCRQSSVCNNGLKWSSLVLCDEDLKFLLKLSSECLSLNNYLVSRPGLVTAANDYFVVNKDILKKYSLYDYAKPIIQKGLFADDSVFFGAREYNRLVSDGKPAFFIDLSSYKKNSCKNVEEYLNLGLEREIDCRFKCKQRSSWFKVPIVKPEEGFFFKRSSNYPKFLKNSHKVYTTDSAYNVSPKTDFDIESIIFSFYNPLTLCFSELYGRHYGGGVLELTPNEFRKLPLPYMKIKSTDFTKFKSGFYNKKSIYDIFDTSGLRVLNGLTGFNISDLERLNNIYKKLVKRRMHKTHKN